MNNFCVELQFVIKMIDKKSLDFVFIAPKLKVNKMVSFWLQFLAGCAYATVLRLSVVCLRL